MNTLPFWEVCLRLGLAMLCGGVIGVERGRKHRPAGFRTYILVCVGAALTMVLSAYMVAMYATWEAALGIELTKGDFSRLGAQVINGIGFLGAGTIIVTGKNQVKGMTTAAGLWTSAIIGLAVGVGYYEIAAYATFLILITEVLLSRLDWFLLSNAKSINVYVEYTSAEKLADIMTEIKKREIQVNDVEISKARTETEHRVSAILSLQLPKKTSQNDILTAISKIDGIRTVEEL